MKKEFLVGLIGLGLVGGQGVLLTRQQNVIQDQKEKIEQVKESNYGLATGTKSFKLENGQHIKTDKFSVQYIETGKGTFNISVQPTNQNQSVSYTTNANGVVLTGFNEK